MQQLNLFGYYCFTRSCYECRQCIGFSTASNCASTYRAVVLLLIELFKVCGVQEELYIKGAIKCRVIMVCTNSLYSDIIAWPEVVRNADIGGENRGVHPDAQHRWQQDDHHP